MSLEHEAAPSGQFDVEIEPRVLGMIQPQVWNLSQDNPRTRARAAESLHAINRDEVAGNGKLEPGISGKLLPIIDMEIRTDFTRLETHQEVKNRALKSLADYALQQKPVDLVTLETVIENMEGGGIRWRASRFLLKLSYAKYFRIAKRFDLEQLLENNSR